MQKIVARALLHGVYVVTARHEERQNGMTAAWVSQVSFRPPLVMVSIAPERYTHELIERSGHFAVNALHEGQTELARGFGFRSGRKTDKLAGVPHHAAANGSPVLDEALAYLECRVVDRVTAGDHTLFLGEVVGGDVLNDREPLPFRWADYFK
jgi:flavin reductase (DIM6/NTAB) family NADH-FMN oxidoreductase RutF